MYMEFDEMSNLIVLSSSCFLLMSCFRFCFAEGTMLSRSTVKSLLLFFSLVILFVFYYPIFLLWILFPVLLSGNKYRFFSKNPNEP